MLFERTFPHHCHGLGFVITFVVLSGADPDVVAGLKIADFGVGAGSVGEFGGTWGRDRGDVLVVGLDDDVFILNFAQNSGERGGVGLISLARRTLTALGIALSSRIAAAGVPNTRADDNLGRTGQGSQQNQGRK